MRKIKLNELLPALQRLQVGVPYDVFQWLLLWEVHKMNEIDFDKVEILHAMNAKAAQALFLIAKCLSLSLDLFQETENESITHTFKRGQLVYSRNECDGKLRWERREYNELGLLKRRETSDGRWYAYKYDSNGRLIGVEADAKSVRKIKKQSHLDITDGSLIEIAL